GLRLRLDLTPLPRKIVPDGAREDHLAQLAFLEYLSLRPAVMSAAALLSAGLTNFAGLFDGCDQFCAFVEIVRRRFFQIDWFAQLQRRQRLRRVQVVRRSD